VTLRNHFAVPKLPAPPVLSPGAPPPNPAALPNPPRSVPDPRSLFLAQTYTLAPLPAEPMAARAADPRVGFFTEAYVDLADPPRAKDRRTPLHRALAAREEGPGRGRLRTEGADPRGDGPQHPAGMARHRARRHPGMEQGLRARRVPQRARAVEQQPADADWSALEGTRHAGRALVLRWKARAPPRWAPARPTRAPARSCAARPSSPRTGCASSASRALDDQQPRPRRQARCPGEFAQRLHAVQLRRRCPCRRPPSASTC
jgi:hypothetical protein